MLMKWCLQLLQLTTWYLVGGVGSFIGFGFLFNLLEQWNTRLISSAFGKWGLLLTGSIGTVVHEGSHALMCLVFRHRIHDIKWFRPFAGQSDGVLGYVSHSYDRQSWYQTAGNFFIGIAPMIGGTLVMILLFKGLLPDAYTQVKQGIQMERYLQFALKGQWMPMIQQVGRDLTFFLKAILRSSYLVSGRGMFFWWSVYSISTHMGLSPADLKGCWTGLVMLFVLVLGLTFILSRVGWRLDTWMPLIVTYNIKVSFFFMIGLVFSGLTLGISWVLARIFA